jgi:hypothetical protein
MPDTFTVEGRHRWPRRYTNLELEAIAKSIGLQELGPHAECLQKAAEAYQWGMKDVCKKRAKKRADFAAEPVFRLSTNKGRRKLLKFIIRLCSRSTPPYKLIALSLSVLDAPTSQLLGPVDVSDPLALKEAAERALPEIPASGPNAERARDQFVGWLACIYLRIKKRSPTRRVKLLLHVKPVRHEEYGEFLDFVRAALTPFKVTKGREAVIKRVLEKHRKNKMHRQDRLKQTIP